MRSKTWEEGLPWIEEEIRLDALIAQMESDKKKALRELEQIPSDDEIWDKLSNLLSGDAEAENEQLRRENATLLEALELVHDFHVMTTMEFVEKYGANITSKQVHDEARRAIALARGEEAEECTDR